jgi:hypothetical protein
MSGDVYEKTFWSLKNRKGLILGLCLHNLASVDAGDFHQEAASSTMVLKDPRGGRSAMALRLHSVKAAS